MNNKIHTRSVLCVILSLLFIMPLVNVSAAPAHADRGPWAPNTAYAVNDTTTYGGSTYKCLQGHTSITTWEPPNTPALWQLVTGGAPTATKTRTPTTGALTVTRTNTPTGALYTATRTPTR